jgi:ABC-type multidrug transport system fused ATPase/permease subunit
MNIILVVIVVAVIIFTIVSSIMGRKAQRIEREKRKKQVKNKIKQYIKDTDNRKNLRLEYEKVIARKGKEFKYRDIFDVIVDIYEAKTNYFLEQKAFEIEGISKKISKKQYETTWIVNQEIDLEETKCRIEISKKKVKLTKEEKKAAKIAERKEYEAYRAEMLKKREEERKLRKNGQLLVDERSKPKPEKFVPRK